MEIPTIDKPDKDDTEEIEKKQFKKLPQIATPLKIYVISLDNADLFCIVHEDEFGSGYVRYVVSRQTLQEFLKDAGDALKEDITSEP